MRWYQLPGSVYYSVWQILVLGGAFEQEEAVGGGGVRVGQLNLCAETKNPSRVQI